ncbi:MAG TPA: LSM domain-containing protein [Nitrososphaeraceae archaeon]|jgi:small nuclear ribonucleoprotein
MSDEGIANQVLYQNIGKLVLVKLKGRRSIRGKLKSFDKQMNLLLQEAIDVTENNLPESKAEIQMGDILIRGDNVIIISVE